MIFTDLEIKIIIEFKEDEINIVMCQKMKIHLHDSNIKERGSMGSNSRQVKQHARG